MNFNEERAVQVSETSAEAKGFLRVSENKHYFVRDSKPFFWMGDTAVSSISHYSYEELEIYFAARAKQGFTVEFIALPLGSAKHETELSWLWDASTTASLDKVKDEVVPVWKNNNPATPDEASVERVRKVIDLAAKYGLLVEMHCCGGSWGGSVHRDKALTVENARIYGRWLGEHFGDNPNLVWSNGFDLPPWWYEDIAREFAEGVLEGNGGKQLIFYHPCGCMSSNYFQNEPWVNATLIQTWGDYLQVHPMVWADYHRKPTKPVIHSEGAFEAGTEYPCKPVNSLKIRQQAYWAYLGGGFHTYGHNEIWRKTVYWKDALESPGARSMKVLGEFFKSIEWWRLVPDMMMFASNDAMGALHAAARPAEGDWAIIYFSSRDTTEICLNRITKGNAVKAEWIDPQSGRRELAGIFGKEKNQVFTSPAWCEDALLFLTAIE